MNEKTREKIAVFRYGIIAPLVSGNFDSTRSNYDFFKHASTLTYLNAEGEDVSVSSTSIARWFKSYQKYGFDGLKPMKRVDQGKSRKLDEDIKSQIIYLKQEFPKLPATLIYQKLIDNGTINKKDISLSTVNRFITNLIKDKRIKVNVEMRRYECAHINDVWCGDSSDGPFLMIGKKKHKVKIIALIDDASRMIVGIDLFFEDNFINLMSVMKSAVAKYGKPKKLNFDNGSPYKNHQMTLLAARIGTTLSYCMPYTPTSKAKIERWFNTLKSQWMSGLKYSDFKSLDQLRESLFAYVHQYNLKDHSSLNGLSPSERFFDEGSLIQRLSNDKIEQAFLKEEERKVTRDAVITLNGIKYEVDYKYSNQRITVRYSHDLSTLYVVNPESLELEPIKILNKVENASIKRKRHDFTGGDESWTTHQDMG